MMQAKDHRLAHAFWALFISALAAALLALPALGVEGKKAKVKLPKNTTPHFRTSDRCFACHNNLVAPNGEDISIGLDWRASMMANSSRDPYWQAGIRRETIDHPESAALIQDECSKCHMPMARYEAKTRGEEGTVFDHFPLDDHTDLAADGVSCSLCHQITPERLGTRESLVGEFVIDVNKPLGEKPVYGPYKIDDGHQTIMRSSSDGFRPTEGEHIRKSELCATCHTLITTALGPDGKVIGSLPEQMPYQEWYASEYKDQKSCQSCHMPEVKDVAITRVLGEKRESMGRHVFVGGNFFIQRMLNKYRSELGTWALPQELATASDRTVRNLENETALIRIENVQRAGGRLNADIAVESTTGHKFPTGYPSRRAWLHVTVKDANSRIVFESGELNANGAITGNDNDADATRFEPHYREITSADQVQIYESIMQDAKGLPTTGLLNALRFVKDNRLLPRGFNKAAVDNEIAPQGEARNDPDFAGGGDRVRYSIVTGSSAGPFRIEAELRYQVTSYRWAHNLENYDAFEPKRFVRYYNEMSGASSVVVAKTEAGVAGR